MNNKLISVLIVLILAMSIGSVSATASAWNAYKNLFPSAPDPAGTGPPDCKGLCHDPSQPTITNYGKELNDTALQIYGERFRSLNTPQKRVILEKVGPGLPLPPVPELNTGTLVTVGLFGLGLLYRKIK